MGFEIFEKGRGRRIQGLLFDMDGLVLDSERLYTRFWREALEELGFHMSFEQALGLRSLSRERGQEYLRSLFGPGVDFALAKSIRIRRMDAYVAEHGVEPKEGVCQLLDYLDSRGIPRAITSSSPPERIRAHLEPLGLYGRFDKICSGYQVARGKPEPDIYLYGAAALGLSPESCLALEDSPAGLLSAARAGCMTVLVPDLDSPGEESLKFCTAKADSLKELPGLIEAPEGRVQGS